MRIYSASKTNSLRRSGAFAVIVFLALLGCSSGGGGGGGTSSVDHKGKDGPQWGATLLKTVNAGGLTAPWVKAAVDEQDRLHVAHFEKPPESGSGHIVSHFSLSLTELDATIAESPAAVQVDNCRGLSLVVANGEPSVIYQGGEKRICGAERQSDVMLSALSGDKWTESTVGIGEIDPQRNPYFNDGLAGAALAAAVDSQGIVHAVYQFHYEGCDAMNFKYPDLLYARLGADGVSLGPEETVEGNDYESTNSQNSVGAHVAMILDGDEQPVVFYYAELVDGSKGLRVARRIDGQWQAEWIEQDCELGYISAALSPDGAPSAAFYATSGVTSGEIDGAQTDHFLGFRTVDESRRCGNYCSLAFDSSGLPAIAYHELESRTGYSLENLKLARFNGATWEAETVSTNGDVGYYNNLWFDEEGLARIVSYSQSEKAIYLFNEEPQSAP